jgi:hypothetical protein
MNRKSVITWITVNIMSKEFPSWMAFISNHELGLEECKHLPLPQSIRKEIQQQFATGITIERIIDSGFMSSRTS